MKYFVEGTVKTNVPVSGAIVKIGNYSTKTDKHGYFKINNIPAGDYTIICSDYTNDISIVNNVKINIILSRLPAPDKVTSNNPTNPPKQLGQFGLVDIYNDFDLVKELKPKNNRIWVNTDNFNTYTPKQKIDSGIKVQSEINAKPIYQLAQEYTTKKQTAGAAQWVLAFLKDAIARTDANPKTKDSIINIGFMNEPDHKYFEDKDVAFYATKVLPIVYKAVKDEYGDRVRLIAGNLSYNYDKLIQNLQPLADNSDAIGYHGYAKSKAELNRYDIVSKAVRGVGKSIISDELGLGYGGKIFDLTEEGKLTEAEKLLAAWPADVTNLIQYVLPLFDEISFFITRSVGSTNSGQALLDSKGNKTVYYNSVKQSLINLGVING